MDAQAHRAKQGDREGGQPEAARGDEAPMAADDGPVLPPSEDGRDEAELAQAPFEGIELGVTDPPEVRRIWAELVDRDVGNSNW